MRGSVVKRGAGWCFVVDIGTDPVTGKRRQKMKGGFRTRKDADRALSEVLGAVNGAGYAEPAKVTFRRFMVDQWLPGISATVRPNTLESYRQMAVAHLVPRLGHLELRHLTAGHLNACYAEMLTSGRRDGAGGLSARTVHLAHVTAHRALRDAVRWNLLARNPADLADPPREERREMACWSSEQLGLFLSSVEGDRLYPLFLLAATTGMRRGELLGLRWTDVDLDSGRLSVTQSLVTVAHRLEISEPKTKKSRRSVSLDPATVMGLRAHRAQSLEERLAMGAGWHGSDLVFTWPDGKPIHPDVVSRTFDRLGRQAGLPRIRFHDIRHSYATAALSAGLPAKVVSSRLGHSSISVTSDIYAHVMPEYDEEAAARVADLILQPAVSNP